MRGNTRWLGIALTLVVVGLGCAKKEPLAPPPPPPPPAADAVACGAPQGQDVVVCLDLDCSTGTCVITVDPDSADVYPTNVAGGRPQFVLWRTSAHDDNYWEITPKSSNGACANGDPYLDTPDAIDCKGAPITKAGPANCEPGDHQQYEWEYDVKVYECVNGTKGAELSVLDPKVIILGGP